MKKNVMMRVASALLVAVLLTTCTISGTFAKYTTEATGADSARVAYWGFQNDAALTFDLFANTYDGSVTGQDNADVVAPGTSKTTDFSFAFKENAAKSITAPEVKYTITVTPTITTTTSYAALDANPNFKWTLKAAGAAAATEYNTVAELEAAIKALSGDATGTKTYEAGNAPTGLNGTCTIGWTWAFEATGDDAAKAAQNETDTAMGNAAALDDISITIAITATQLD